MKLRQARKILKRAWSQKPPSYTQTQLSRAGLVVGRHHRRYYKTEPTVFQVYQRVISSVRYTSHPVATILSDAIRVLGKLP